jgi:Uma2 family endonuclease
MGDRPQKQKGAYSWEDYLDFPDDHRWEIVGGEVFDMTASPASRHQIISQSLVRRLGDFLDKKSCRVFHAPMDVKLSEQDVVQPDLFVIYRETQIRETHIEGPPELAIEILSPSSVFHDRIRKLNLYLRHGVQEYWLVTPFPSSVEIFLLDGNTYRLHSTFAKADILTSPSLDGLKIDLTRVFDFPVDPQEEMSVVREGHPVYATT